MRRFGIGAAVVLLVSAAHPAQACRDDDQKADLAQVRTADMIVAGRVANYQIVPTGPRKDAQHYQSGPHYARFDILVDEVIFGSAVKTLSVTLDHDFFVESPTMGPGPYIIALRAPKPQNPAKPLPKLMTVLQEGCDPAFIFKTTSKEAAEVRRILGSPVN